MKKIVLHSLSFLFATLFLPVINVASLYGQCCQIGPNLLANYNPDFSIPAPSSGIPPGFKNNNTYAASPVGGGYYYIIASRNYGACSGSNVQYDHTSGNSTGKFLWFDTPTGTSATNPSVCWTPHDPVKPAATQNLINVKPNTDYVFSAWFRDLARNADCINGGAPLPGLRINDVDMAQINLANFTSPCCPEWENLCVTWNSGSNTTVKLEIMAFASSGYTDLGIDDVYFGESLSNFKEDLLGKDTVVCSTDTITLESPFPGNKSLWNGIDTGKKFIVTTPGIYWLKIEADSCSIVDTIHIDMGSAPDFSLGNDTTICYGSIIKLEPKPKPTGSGIIYHWSNGSSASSINVNRSDTYWLRIETNCGIKSDTIQVTTEPKITVNLPADIETCLSPGDSIDIHAESSPAQNYTYTWKPTNYLRNSNQNNNRFSAPPGVYWLIATAQNSKGCTGKDSMKINILDNIDLKVTPKDTLIEYGESVHLQASGADSYTWFPSIFLDNFQIADPIAKPEDNTVFKVIGQAKKCTDSAFATIRIHYETNVFVPNAFTPNGDGLNDIFKIENIRKEKIKKFEVYNRWGQRVFKSWNPSQGWDGTIKGKRADMGVYFYYILIQLPNDKEQLFQGDLMLIR